MELFKTTPDGIVKCGKRSQRLICNFCPKIVDVIFANNNHNLKQILCLQLTATFKGAKVVKNVDIDFEIELNESPMFFAVVELFIIGHLFRYSYNEKTLLGRFSMSIRCFKSSIICCSY